MIKKAFFCRNSSLSVRPAKTKRKAVITELCIRKFVQSLKEYMKMPWSIQDNPQRNEDGTSFVICSKNRKVIGFVSSDSYFYVK